MIFIVSRLTTVETEWQTLNNSSAHVYSMEDDFDFTIDNTNASGVYLTLISNSDFESGTENTSKTYILDGYGGVGDGSGTFIIQQKGTTMDSVLRIVHTGNGIEFSIKREDGSDSNYSTTISDWDYFVVDNVTGVDYSITDFVQHHGIWGSMDVHLNAIESVLRRKLWLIDKSDMTSNLSELTQKLLYFKDNDLTGVSLPSYGNNLTIADAGDVASTYDSFLRSVVDYIDYDDSLASWYRLINQIQVTPSISLTASNSSPSSGDTVTMTATVTYDGSPVSGVPVTFKDGSNNTLSTGTTNSSGVATYTFTYSASVTIKAVTTSYGNFSTVTSGEVTFSTIIFSDAASSSGLSKYAYYIRKEGSATPTMSYSSSVGAYALSSGDGCNAYYPIKACRPITTNFVFEADVKPTTTGSENCVGLAIGKTSTNDRLILVYLDHGTGHNAFAIRQWNTTSRYLANPSKTLYASKWYHIKCTLIGTSLSVVITCEGSTVMDSTVTVGNEFNVTNNDIQLGLYTGWTGTVNGYIKNIKVSSA